MYFFVQNFMKIANIVILIYIYILTTLINDFSLTNKTSECEIFDIGRFCMWEICIDLYGKQMFLNNNQKW